MVRIGPVDAVAGPTMCSSRARKRPSKKPPMMVSVGPDFGNTPAAYRTASKLAIRRENRAASGADERAIAGKSEGYDRRPHGRSLRKHSPERYCSTACTSVGQGALRPEREPSCAVSSARRVCCSHDAGRVAGNGEEREVARRAKGPLPERPDRGHDLWQGGPGGD